MNLHDEVSEFEVPKVIMKTELDLELILNTSNNITEENKISLRLAIRLLKLVKNILSGEE